MPYFVNLCNIRPSQYHSLSPHSPHIHFSRHIFELADAIGVEQSIDNDKNPAPRAKKCQTL